MFHVSASLFYFFCYIKNLQVLSTYCSPHRPFSIVCKVNFPVFKNFFSSFEVFPFCFSKLPNCCSHQHSLIAIKYPANMFYDSLMQLPEIFRLLNWNEFLLSGICLQSMMLDSKQCESVWSLRYFSSALKC